MKKAMMIILGVGVATVLLLLLTYYGVGYSSRKSLYNSVQQIPENKVGMVLGTTKYLKNGYVNLYFKYRIDATVQLYQAGKIKYVLVSGDNSRTEYDEPTDFKEELIKRGIPENRIYLDYAGFRTLDSVVRAKKIFGQDKLTIISQQFHNERALFIARFKNMDAVAFNAKDVAKRYGIKVIAREYLARVKVLLDLLLGVQPKFLGEPISIG